MSEVRTRERYAPGMAWNSRCLRYKLACLIGVTWTLYILCSMFNLFYYVNIVVFPMTHNVICAGAIITLTLLEPPCGSNTYVLDDGRELLFVDGGFRCFLPRIYWAMT